MSCCGQRRAQWSTRYRTAARELPPPPPLIAALRYTGTAPLSLRGPVSGRVYFLLEAGVVITPDPRDARALLATRLFLREDGVP